MMNKLNIFSVYSPFYSLRWYAIAASAAILWLGYANYTGWRILSFNNQEKWSASGPGSHK